MRVASSNGFKKHRRCGRLQSGKFWTWYWGGGTLSIAIQPTGMRSHVGYRMQKRFRVQNG